MAGLLRNPWVQLAALGIVMALLGLVVSAVRFSGGPAGPSLGPVKLTTGGKVVARFTAGGVGPGDAPPIVEELLPLTAAEAVEAGWTDPILCSAGRGKYFKKTGGEQVPYLLMYDANDQLTGMYNFSETEMPPPWEHMEEITGGAGAVLDFEHWGLFVYFREPLRACISKEGGCGYAGYCSESNTGFFKSDGRLKRNQSTVPYGLDAVMELEPKIYDKYDGALHDGEITLDENSRRTEMGLIAQDALGVIPEIVAVPDDPENGFYGVAYEQLTPVLIKSIQELKAEIDALKAEIEALKK